MEQKIIEEKEKSNKKIEELTRDYEEKLCSEQSTNEEMNSRFEEDLEKIMYEKEELQSKFTN